MPRWPQTPEEAKHFAMVQQALGAFMAETPWGDPLRLKVQAGEILSGDLHGVHTRTSVSYPIQHAATVLIYVHERLHEIDFLDIDEVC